MQRRVIVVPETYCWWCCPPERRHRYERRGKCPRCAAEDDDAAPIVYTPEYVRWIVTNLRNWEDLGLRRPHAADVTYAISRLAVSGRLSELEVAVYDRRMYHGFSESLSAKRIGCAPITVRRVANCVARKVAIYLNSPEKEKLEAHKRLIRRIFNLEGS